MLLSVAPLGSTPRGSTPPYVLLVDDHAPSLERLSRVLEEQGYRCRTACSVSEAISRCDDGCPALVVTDLNMPRVDGRGLAGWLKSRHPTTPVVLMTSECLDSVSLAALRQAFVAVLSKPLDLEPLFQLLGELMTSHRPTSGA